MKIVCLSQRYANERPNAYYLSIYGICIYIGEPMTHDELLEKIDEAIKYMESMFSRPTPRVAEAINKVIERGYALRAVVELHKPNNTNEYCVGCGAHYYPCETIQAIEKELK